jgi:tetratricopeptide (TPR) repeat protein
MAPVIPLWDFDAEPHYNLGRLLAAQGKVEEAIAEYRAAAKLQPELAEARSDLGNLLSAQGKWQEAVEAYRAAIEIKPDEAPFHYELGLILMKQGKQAEAIAAFREAHDHDRPGSDLARLIERALSESGH